MRGFEGSRLGKGIHTVGGRLSKEFKFTSVMPQRRVLCPLLFLLYVNDIWGIIDSSIRLFANIYNIRITYVKHTNNNDIANLQKVLDKLGEWAVENGMKINPGKGRQ